MSTTPRFGLPCPEGTDYAAIALYLQRLAEAAEAKILDERAMVDNFVRQPVGIWQNAFNITASSGATVSNISVDSPVFVNARAAARTVQGFSGFGALFTEPGVYHVGWNVSMTELTTVTTNTPRTINFTIRQLDGSGADIVLADLSRRVNASSVVTERFGSDGLVVVNELVRPQINARIEFTNGDPSGSVRISPPNFKCWYRRIGSTTQIEVA